MLELQDDYAASQQRGLGLGCGFWLIWTVATTVGGFLGQLIAQYTVRAFLPADTPLPVVMLALIPFGLVAGAVIGLAQGLVLLRHIKAMGFRDWIIASALGGVLRWALLGPLSSILVFAMNTGFVQCNTLIPLILFGALSGAAFGLPQSFVLSRHLRQTTELEWWTWTLANAAGGVFYLPFVTLSGLMGAALLAAGGVVTDDYAVRALIAITLNWLITGLITGLPLQERLRRTIRPTAAHLYADD